MSEDLIVIGGSFAGLNAALYLGRAGRKVLVVDAAQPRNRYAKHSHGLFGFDGQSPSDMLELARTQTLSYPTVGLINTTATGIECGSEGFSVSTGDGDSFIGRRVLLAIGVIDTLPDIEGIRDRWGNTVLHCPYCHGYEFMGQRIGVIAHSPMAVHQALLLADWGAVTLLTNGMLELDSEQQARLAARQVHVEASPVKRLQGQGLHGQGQTLDSVVLEDGRQLALDVMYIATRVSFGSDWVEPLGCVIDQGPLGPIIRTDDKQLTSVAGLYAAGDCARQPHNATFACAEGVTAAMAIHASLIEEDIQRDLLNH